MAMTALMLAIFVVFVCTMTVAYRTSQLRRGTFITTSIQKSQQFKSSSQLFAREPERKITRQSEGEYFESEVIFHHKLL